MDLFCLSLGGGQNYEREPKIQLIFVRISIFDLEITISIQKSRMQKKMRRRRPQIGKDGNQTIFLEMSKNDLKRKLVLNYFGSSFCLAYYFVLVREDSADKKLNS